jgi:hypothetical protein
VCDLGVRAGDPEDAGEQVGVEGVLVVAERRKNSGTKPPSSSRRLVEIE